MGSSKDKGICSLSEISHPGDCRDCSANGEVIRWRECGKRFIEEEQ